jgi:hypothetical protein
VTCRRFTLAQARRVQLHSPLARRFPARDLLVGMNVEREHGNITHCSPVLSAKIALAHLRERPDYYRRLLRYVER